MTKKHFQALAATLLATKRAILKGAAMEQTIPAWRETVIGVANVCAQANPRFDRSRFLRACGMED